MLTLVGQGRVILLAVLCLVQTAEAVSSNSMDLQQHGTPTAWTSNSMDLQQLDNFPQDNQYKPASQNNEYKPASQNYGYSCYDETGAAQGNSGLADMVSDSAGDDQRPVMVVDLCPLAGALPIVIFESAFSWWHECLSQGWSAQCNTSTSTQQWLPYVQTPPSPAATRSGMHRSFLCHLSNKNILCTSSWVLSSSDQQRMRNMSAFHMRFYGGESAQSVTDVFWDRAQSAVCSVCLQADSTRAQLFTLCQTSHDDCLDTNYPPDTSTVTTTTTAPPPPTTTTTTPPPPTTTTTTTTAPYNVDGSDHTPLTNSSRMGNQAWSNNPILPATNMTTDNSCQSDGSHDCGDAPSAALKIVLPCVIILVIVAIVGAVIIARRRSHNTSTSSSRRSTSATYTVKIGRFLVAYRRKCHTRVLPPGHSPALGTSINPTLSYSLDTIVSNHTEAIHSNIATAIEARNCTPNTTEDHTYASLYDREDITCQYLTLTEAKTSRSQTHTMSLLDQEVRAVVPRPLPINYICMSHDSSAPRLGMNSACQKRESPNAQYLELAVDNSLPNVSIMSDDYLVPALEASAF